MSAPRVAGLVLAAGASSRMEDAQKLLLPYRGATVVRAVVEAARAGGLDPVVAVVGHRAEEVAREVDEAGGEAVENPAYASGVASSLAVGVRRLAADRRVRGVTVLMGDEPGVRPEAIRAAVEAWREGEAAVLRTRYRDRPGHPVIFARSTFASLAGLRGDRGARELLDPERPGVAHLDLDLAAPIDIDTPGAYDRAVAREPEAAGPERR